MGPPTFRRTDEAKTKRANPWLFSPGGLKWIPPGPRQPSAYTPSRKTISISIRASLHARRLRLVPKLRLGTPGRKLCFRFMAVTAVPATKSIMPNPLVIAPRPEEPEAGASERAFPSGAGERG
jgi:hypothetical protein